MAEQPRTGGEAVDETEPRRQLSAEEGLVPEEAG